MSKTKILRSLWSNFFILIIILSLGWFSNFLGEFDNSIVLPIYLPSAMTFFWIFRYNYRVIPGIFIGTALEASINLYSATRNYSFQLFLVVVGISVANTLQPLIIKLIIEKIHYKRETKHILLNLPQLFVFLFASIVGCSIAGVIGPLSLILGGFIPSIVFWHSMLSWLISDLAAIFLICPVLIALNHLKTRQKPILEQKDSQFIPSNKIKKLEGFIFWLLSILTQYLVLFRFGLSYTSLRFEYLIMIFIIWASFRFSSLTAHLHIFCISFLTIAGIYSKTSPFYAGDIEMASLLMQIFLIIMAAINMILNALIYERKIHFNTKILSGFLPICSICKKIRNKDGTWNFLEEYMDHHSEAKFTHSYCPDCSQKLID